METTQLRACEMCCCKTRTLQAESLRKESNPMLELEDLKQVLITPSRHCNSRRGGHANSLHFLSQNKSCHHRTAPQALMPLQVISRWSRE